MPADTQKVWLTEHTYDRLRVELAELLVERATEAHRGDPDRERRDLRIRHLQELIITADIGHPPPDDGVAEPGMVLTVRYEAAHLTETFLLGHREEAIYDAALPVYSPHSPLGRALTGAKQGERCEYRVPGGATMTVTLIRAVPYHHQGCTSRPTGTSL